VVTLLPQTFEVFTMHSFNTSCHMAIRYRGWTAHVWQHCLESPTQYTVVNIVYIVSAMAV